MAYLTQPDYVKYVCSCGHLKPITSLYFCRHCLKIRCGFCICHEVDSHYCANCLENMPSSEARLKKNRCSSCFDCPSCFHTLSTRATLAKNRPSQEAPPEGGDTKVENKAPKKVYYLSCFNCRWTSRDVGIPDQPVASGGWPERTNPHAARINQLLEYYKAIAQQEKQEKLERERKKFTIRGKYITLTDKTGLTGAMARSLAGMSPAEGGFSSALANFVPSEASEEVEGLPDDIYTKEVDLKQITSMPQRLASPEWQPELVTRLQPIPRALSVKRSQRCRRCDHNLTKPEYNPGSIKFKIELLAFYHVPEIKIISCTALKAGADGTLVLKLSNPAGYEVRCRLLTNNERTQEGEQTGEGASPDSLAPVSQTAPEAVPQAVPDAVTQTPGVMTPVAPGVVTPVAPGLVTPVAPGLVTPVAPGLVTPVAPVTPMIVRLSLPETTLALPPRDDAAEYDDDQGSQQPLHQMILWRKSNKMALRLSLNVEEATMGQRATAALLLEYSYRNTVPTSGAQPRPTQDHTLYANVVLDLGLVTA